MKFSNRKKKLLSFTRNFLVTLKRTKKKFIHIFQKYIYNIEYQEESKLDKNNFPTVFFSDWLLKEDISEVLRGNSDKF